jgi:hypothetical protein
MNGTRKRLLVLTVIAGALAVLGALPTTASGGGNGCPSWGNPGGNPGVRDSDLMPINAAVQRTVAQITPAWYAAVGITQAELVTDRTASMTAQDKNLDGFLCVAETWGTELNPNSKWALYWGDLLNPAETQKFLVTDNHRGTSNNA